MDAYENIMKIETIPNSYPEYEHINSNKDLTLFYKSKGENPFQQFIKDLVKYCATFACKGFGNAYMDKKPSLVKCKFIEKYQQRLKDAIITSKDYKEILQEYDDEKTLFYLDPPYESCKQLYHNETMDMVELRDILKNIKGKFILSLNDSSNIRTLFQDFVIIDFIQKSVNNKDIGTKARKEVIILNFFFL